MKLSNIPSYGIEIIRDPGILMPSKPVFIISHMRSYSSLLVNILSSNEEIYGGVEMLQSYKSYKDLLKLQIKARKLKKVRSGIVLDKILHNQYELHLEFLRRFRPSMIFTSRDPIESITSISELYKKYTSRNLSMDEICQYYLKRQEGIREQIRWSNDLGLATISFRAEKIVDDNENILKLLTRFLNLRSPLIAKYKVHEMIGKPQHGDLSPNIKAGKVIKRDKSKTLLKPARAVFEQLQSASKETLDLMNKYAHLVE